MRWTGTPQRIALGLILLLHVVATISFLPPTEVFRDVPLEMFDYPVHTHRVHVYQEGLRESGFPWGYDPAVSAGTVMNPGQDSGAKALQVFSMVVPFVSPAVAVKLFVFLTLLCFPLLVLQACRLMEVPPDAQLWVLLLLVIPAWLDYRIIGFVRWGLIGFVAASYFSVLVLGLFLRNVRRPSPKSYFVFVLAASVLLLLHILGPIVLLPALVGYTLLAENLSPAQRLSLAAVPILVVLINVLWLYPLLLAQNVPQPVGFNPVYPPDSITHLRFGDSSALDDPFSSPLTVGSLLVATALFAYGIAILRRTAGSRTAVALTVCGITGLLLTLFGSAFAATSALQPVRFVVPTFALMSIPVGTAVGTLVTKTRLNAVWTAASISVAVVIAGVALGFPRSLETSPRHESLQTFIKTQTGDTDRLLIQSADGYNYGDYESKAFPMMLGREVIGSNFPQSYDPPQFLRTMLLGRKIGSWRPNELRQALDRWGITWVFTITDEANSLMGSILKGGATEVGEYLAYRVEPVPSRFVAGSGDVVAAINRIELSNLSSDDGIVILKYRYHPAWEANTNTVVYRHPVEEDASGFLALRNPPDSLVLRFRPWIMLRAPWPSGAANQR